MKLLLDTHTVIWWLSDDPRLPLPARTVIADRANQLLVSAAVGYETVYKQSQGRLPPSPESLPLSLRREGVDLLPITLEHAVAAAQLPGPHRDPWDRIMIAQAMLEQLRVVTVDKVFSDYGVPVIW